jgi:hypothetical protein
VRVAEIAAGKDKEAANAKAYQSQFDLEGKIWDAKNKGINDTIAGFGNIMDAAMTCYDKESSEYKRLADIKKVVMIAEQGMIVARNIALLQSLPIQAAATTAAAGQATTQGAAAILTAGTGGDGYTAFGRVAAMMAIVAAVLSAAGIAGGFGGGASSATAALPKSTVLGAADGTGSESVSNSYKLLQETYDLEDRKLSEIRNELQSLNENITGLVTSIVITGGISAQGMGVSVSGDSQYGDFLQRVERWGGGFGHLVGADSGFIGQLEDFLSKPLMQIASWIGGGEKSQSINSAGISIGGNLSSGMTAQQYADIVTKTNGGAFASDSYRTDTQYLELKSEVSSSIN